MTGKVYDSIDEDAFMHVRASMVGDASFGGGGGRGPVGVIGGDGDDDDAAATAGGGAGWADDFTGGGGGGGSGGGATAAGRQSKSKSNSKTAGPSSFGLSGGLGGSLVGSMVGQSNLAQRLESQSAKRRSSMTLDPAAMAKGLLGSLVMSKARPFLPSRFAHARVGMCKATT